MCRHTETFEMNMSEIQNDFRNIFIQVFLNFHHQHIEHLDILVAKENFLLSWAISQASVAACVALVVGILFFLAKLGFTVMSSNSYS